MPWDRKRLLGYVETIQLILGVTDKYLYTPYFECENIALCIEQSLSRSEFG